MKAVLCVLVAAALVTGASSQCTAAESQGFNTCMNALIQPQNSADTDATCKYADDLVACYPSCLCEDETTKTTLQQIKETYSATGCTLRECGASSEEDGDGEGDADTEEEEVAADEEGDSEEGDGAGDTEESGVAGDEEGDSEEGDVAGGAFSFSASTLLEGLTIVDWTPAAETNFKEQIAIMLGNTADDVEVTGTTATTSRRSLLAAGLTVDYTVSGFTSSEAAAAAGTTLKEGQDELMFRLQNKEGFKDLTGLSTTVAGQSGALRTGMAWAVTLGGLVAALAARAQQ